MAAAVPPQTLSEAGAKFMTQSSFDSFHAMPYLDPGNLWTVGYGQRISDPKEYPHGITQEEALQLFQTFTQSLAAALRKCPFAGFNQAQFDAIMSLSYNIGLNAFMGSTIYKRLSVRSIDLSPWGEWVHDAKGRLDVGLVKRRQAELKLFIYGLYI